MSKNTSQKNKRKETTVFEVQDSPDPQSKEQTELRTKNLVEFAKYSFELEEKREQSLINQSGMLLTAFSVSSALLLMAVPILIEHTSIPKGKILLFAGIALFLMLVSMLLAVISQWRFRYVTMMNGEELLKKVEEHLESHVFQSQYDYQWIDQLKNIQNSKKKNNDRRYHFVHASMIAFLLSIICLIVFAFIIAFS